MFWPRPIALRDYTGRGERKDETPPRFPNIAQAFRFFTPEWRESNMATRHSMDAVSDLEPNRNLAIRVNK